MPESTTVPAPSSREEGKAVMVLADGTVLRGQPIGASGVAVGEVCFNTSMTGYQEIMTDPSYAGQIITFTFPHVGNVGTNEADIETTTPVVRGVVLRMPITEPSNYRATRHLDAWLKAHNLIGLAGIDTRRVTRLIRDGGPQTGVLCTDASKIHDTPTLTAIARAWPGLEGMDLAKEVSCTQSYAWSEGRWSFAGAGGYEAADRPRFHVVAVDFGAKRNILRCLASAGCRVTVVPAAASAEEILRHRPDGVFLSNGPGDPAATGRYAVPMLQTLIKTGLPIFGICLGHQILALALGGKTHKMARGHRGANHPVKDLATGKVEITSQNHGFVVDPKTLPAGVVATHLSLFDGSVEGLAVDGKPVFSVQYHPEASPGPTDSHYLFDRFVKLMEARS
ncbi:MAG: glutamine-hydrolyzing carbamoyl-phosphate synthase small subunit [Alphaproteobacteria bacterium]|nr:glutamine-hydrolyzing carbamoyl-phosphate synthase small subunit [Alphaproteobacteria bacterium]